MLFADESVQEYSFHFFRLIYLTIMGQVARLSPAFIRHRRVSPPTMVRQRQDKWTRSRARSFRRHLSSSILSIGLSTLSLSRVIQWMRWQISKDYRWDDDDYLIRFTMISFIRICVGLPVRYLFFSVIWLNFYSD